MTGVNEKGTINRGCVVSAFVLGDKLGLSARARITLIRPGVCLAYALAHTSPYANIHVHTERTNGTLHMHTCTFARILTDDCALFNCMTPRGQRSRANWRCKKFTKFKSVIRVKYIS